MGSFGRSYLVVLLAAFAFATSGPFGKLTAGLSPMLVAALRTGIASILITLFIPKAVLRSLGALSRGERVRLFIAGAALAAHFSLFLAGLQNTSLSAAVALVSLEPLAVVLFSWVLSGIRPSRREAVGIFIATCGAVIVASQAGEGEHRFAGDAMVLVCVVFFGIYVASARPLKDALPPLPYAALVYGVSAACLLPIVLFTWQPAAEPSRIAILSVVGLAIIPTLVGHTLVQNAARHLSPSIVALVSPGETIGSIAIGAFFMSQVPTTHEAAGALLVILGAACAVTDPRHKVVDEPEA